MRARLAAFLLLGAFVTARAEEAHVGILTIEIPGGFEAQAAHHMDPAGQMETNSWRAADGRTIEVLYFTDISKYDLGPLVVARQEPIEVAGQKTSLIETERFYGLPKKVLVAHLRFGKSRYMVDSEHMPKEEFVRLLGSIRVQADKADHRP